LKKAALEAKQVAPAVSALTLKAKLAGFLIERRLVENPTPLTPERFVGGPPPETYEQFVERRRRELRGEPSGNEAYEGGKHAASASLGLNEGCRAGRGVTQDSRFVSAGPKTHRRVSRRVLTMSRAGATILDSFGRRHRRPHGGIS
jgi:hypothetical protein